MKVRHLAMAAALAALGISSSATRAAEPLDASALALHPVYGQQEAAPSLRPLMSLLDRAGVADTLIENRIDIYGHIEAGWTHAFNDPAGDLILGRVFDIEHDDPTLNQIDLNVERKLDMGKASFDVGGRVELLYGGDARFLHSNGIGDGEDFFSGPDNQLDLLQAYLDFGIPVGDDRLLRLRVGKFLFFKQVDPNASVFYSHSYTFGAPLPFTLSGVSAYYEVGDQWGFEAGVNRGGGQSLEDNNDSVSYHGKVTYRPSDRTTVSVLGMIGPELDDNEQDLRGVVDLVIRHQISDRLTFLLDTIYGFQNNAPEADDAGATGDNAWYGAAGYLVYEVNEQVSAGARVEWFHDEGGYTTGVDQNLYEATVGLTLTPFATDEWGQNLKIRPEIRYDYSDTDYFDGLSSNNQLTFGIDAIFNF